MGLASRAKRGERGDDEGDSTGGWRFDPSYLLSQANTDAQAAVTSGWLDAHGLLVESIGGTATRRAEP